MSKKCECCDDLADIASELSVKLENAENMIDDLSAEIINLENQLENADREIEMLGDVEDNGHKVRRPQGDD